jgi:hypothetical protein
MHLGQALFLAESPFVKPFGNIAETAIVFSVVGVHNFEKGNVAPGLEDKQRSPELGVFWMKRGSPARSRERMAKMRKLLIVGQVLLLALLLLPLQPASAQDTAAAKTFKQEELDQMLAPLALYPDSLLAQILMASTYPLEVVQAARWAEANKSLKDEAMTKALEKESWDASVKSLVAFPDVLKMMDEKLDWTQKVGDAFLAQQKQVMDTVQNLRKKAKDSGNLETNKEQKVVVEKETQVIVIESADPKVVYVPAYNPAVVYGSWWWPSYPPYPYYPYGYVPGAAAFGFCAGVALGAAWGGSYGWGHCDWHGGNVNVNMNNFNLNNANINRNVNRTNIGNGAGGGNWNHNPEHRKGTPYRDNGTAQRFDKGGSRDAQSRDAFRGQAESGRGDLAKGGADQFKGRNAGAGQGQAGRGDGGANRAGAGAGRSDGAFGGSGSGKQASTQSNRGRESMSGAGGGRGGSSAGRSSGGGGGRSSGMSSGGGRGGGGRGGGGGGGGGRGGGGRR